MTQIIDSIFEKVKKRLRKKSRAEIIQLKAASIFNDLLLLDLANEELASVVVILRDKTTKELKKRNTELKVSKELTKYAIEIIK